MDIPGQDEPSGPGILIGLPSLLDSGLLAAVILGASTPVKAAADSNLEEDPVADWETLGRDDPKKTMECEFFEATGGAAAR
jgi:hypothetical protein